MAETSATNVALEGKLHDVLAKCGVDPALLLRSLGRTRAVISGSVPVAVLTNLPFTPNDVDMYVPEAEETAMLKALEDEQGFYRDATVNMRYPDHLGFSTIHWYQKGDYKINVIVVIGDNALVVLLKFHSTIVMNFVSFHGIFCAYPELTEHNMGLASPAFWMEGPSFRRKKEGIEKYRARGAEMYTKLTDISAFASHECGVDANCPSTVRYMHDGKGKFVPLFAHRRSTTTSIFDAYDGRSSVVWSLGGGTCGQAEKFHDLFSHSLDLDAAHGTTP
ncbi:hypothetical protein B0H11DRAFT_2236183 [Mycena galericulata]|nr:hypothetical protein B0H11DRAFT_2236183 [Mycena galericulata]